MLDQVWRGPVLSPFTETISEKEWSDLRTRAWRYQVLHRFRPDGRSWTWWSCPERAETN